MPQAVRRLGVLAIALTLVLVPAMARARQHVEHRDATRLSIKHSWIGVAPPSKATVAPQPILALPPIAADPDPARIVRRASILVAPALHPVPAKSPEPLRGPPAPALS
jgi:hypothetical protein